MPPNAAYDMRYLEAALEVLEDFLKSQEMYWNLAVTPPPGEPPYPQLSLGNVLLAWQRLQRPLAVPQVQQRDTLGRALERLRQRYSVLWEQKARREGQMRARLWAQYVDELGRHEEARAYYAHEVRHRTILELLREHASLAPAVLALSDHADRRLRVRFVPGAFVWEPGIAPAFPQPRFWFLYGRPR